MSSTGGIFDKEDPSLGSPSEQQDGELTKEKILEMRKQLEMKKKEIEEERKRIALRREQRQNVLTTSSPSLTPLSSSSPAVPTTTSVSHAFDISKSLPANPTRSREEITELFYTLHQQPSPKSETSVEGVDAVTHDLSSGLHVSQQQTKVKKDIPVTFKVERAAIVPKFDYIVSFTLTLTSEEEDKEISFEFNTLEDTVAYVSHDLISELQVHSRYESTICNLLTQEVDRLMKDRESKKKSDLLTRAETLHSIKRFGEAEFCYTTLLELIDDDESSAIIAMKQSIYLGLGNINYKHRQYKEARYYYEQFLLLESRLKMMPGSGNSSPRVTTNASNSHNSSSHNNPTNLPDESSISNSLKAFIGLAKIHSKETEFKKAENILKGALQDQGESDLSISAEVIRKNLVKVYEKQGKLYEAEAVYKRLYDDYSHTYTTLESQAEKLIQTGNLTEAQELFKEALRLKESTLPVLECLALLYMKHNKYKEAMDCFTSCLEMKEKLRDPEHFSITETLCNIAQVFIFQSRWEEAETHLLKGIKIAEKALHSNENLAQWFESKGQQDDLKRMTLRNLEIRKALLVALNRLFDLYTELQRSEDAQACKRKLSELSQSVRYATASTGL